jgi:hypothetical protein
VQHDVRDRVEPAWRQVLGAADEIPRSVVDEPVERPPVVPDPLRHRVDRGCVADVDRMRLHRPAVLRRERYGSLVEHLFAATA